MKNIVVNGAKLQCMFGSSPASLVVTSQSENIINNQKIATVMDFAAGTCISGFGQCSSPMNPAVAAANGAPVTCAPVIVSQWLPPATKSRIKGIPVLIKTARTSCAYAAMGIAITDQAQAKAATQ